MERKKDDSINSSPAMADVDLDDPQEEHSSRENATQEENELKRFPCTECGERFMFPFSLQKHVKKVHLAGKPIECPECDKKFGSVNSLNRHSLMHTGEKTHVCPLCQESFYQDINLTRHLKKHFNDKPYECEICHKRFAENGGLKIHLRTHSGERPYSCDECGKNFAQRGTLEKHVKTHSKIIEKVFKCTRCDEEFANKMHLLTHSKIHNPETKFECTVCSKTYSSLSGLYKHKKIHESEGNLGALHKRKNMSTDDEIPEGSATAKNFHGISGHHKHMKVSESQDTDEGDSLSSGITDTDVMNLSNKAGRDLPGTSEGKSLSLVKEEKLTEISKVFIKEEEPESGNESEDGLPHYKEIPSKIQIKVEQDDD